MNPNEENNKSNKENNPFSVPGDYFSSFSQKMMHKIELADELKEFKLLSSISKELPFVTPSGYFESKSELAQYPSLSALRNKSVFVVPENYFEDAAVRLKEKAMLAEEMSVYPTLASIDKQNVFEVPAGYFENFSPKVRATITAGNNEQDVFTKVLHIVFSKKTVYAIAAMLVISLGIYVFNLDNGTVNTDCNTVACLDKNEIIKTNQLNSFDEEVLIEAVNTDDLQKNLNKVLEQNATSSEDENTESYILENVDVNDITDEI